MQSQAHRMRNRVSRKFARVPGQHGDGYIPQFYPVSVNSSVWGTPWGKVKEGKAQCMIGFVLVPLSYYFIYKYQLLGRLRTQNKGKRPPMLQTLFRWNDMDDPDYVIRREEFVQERAENKLEVRWGGTNFLSSYLWQPNDPEPEIRRKAPPHGAH